MKTVDYAMLERLREVFARRCKNRTAQSRIEDVQIYPGYAEPGYDDPKGGFVALGNWNDITHWDEASRSFVTDDDTPGALGKALEMLGVELEWEDEWVACDTCGKLFRTNPNCHGWQQSGTIDDGGCCCADCLDPVAHLEALEGQDSRCNTIASIDPAQHGYIRLDIDFENGLYGGQAASPQLIGSILHSVRVKRYLFNLDATGQFDITFSVYLHKSESRRRHRALRALQAGQTDGVDPAIMAQKALAACSAASVPGCVVVNHCNLSDGSVKTEVLTPQQFADGGAK
jgi:hypothetical protein